MDVLIMNSNFHKTYTVNILGTYFNIKQRNETKKCFAMFKEENDIIFSSSNAVQMIKEVFKT